MSNVVECLQKRPLHLLDVVGLAYGKTLLLVTVQKSNQLGMRVNIEVISQDYTALLFGTYAETTRIDREQR
jgi:hypothetical protein